MIESVFFVPCGITAGIRLNLYCIMRTFLSILILVTGTPEPSGDDWKDEKGTDSIMLVARIDGSGKEETDRRAVA